MGLVEVAGIPSSSVGIRGLDFSDSAPSDVMESNYHASDVDTEAIEAFIAMDRGRALDKLGHRNRQVQALLHHQMNNVENQMAFA
jgi:hypothetical protein